MEREEVRDVHQKRRVLILLVIGLFLPSAAFAAERTSEIGIGFSEIQTPSQPSPPDEAVPRENVLPMTATRSGENGSTPTKRGVLPQTGENQASILRLVGIVCLMVCYWLFLFLRIKEEEERYD